VPLSLRPPRKGKTPNFEIRGTYLGCGVETSSGTHKRSVALQQIKRIEECIEQHGQWPAPEVKADPGEPTFLSAAIAYMEAGGERQYVGKLVKHFRETPLSQIDQDAIDKAAVAIYPHVTPATRSRQVYTPVSGILHHALGDVCLVIKRPKGSKGREIKDFMWPGDAFDIIDAAATIDEEFGLYLLVLIYTGIRKSEGLDLRPEDTQPDELVAWLRDSKNGDPRMLQLLEDLAARVRAHLEKHPGRDRLFRFKDGGWFKHLLMRAKLAVLGLPCPKRRPIGWKAPENRLAFVGFHTFRHTWATWMRHYGGADVQGLVDTGNWRSARSAQRYSHAVPRTEWARVENLPSPGTKRGKVSNG
jgi:integrase